MTLPFFYSDFTILLYTDSNETTKGEAMILILADEAAMPMPAPVVHLLSFFLNRSLKKQMRDLGIDPKTPSPHQPK